MGSVFGLFDTLANFNSCYNLMDNEEQKKSLVVQYAVAWSLIVGTLQASLVVPEILVPIVLIFWITVLKIRERKRALLAATRSTFGMAKITKIIADFSKYKAKHHKQNSGRPPYFVAPREIHTQCYDEKHAAINKVGSSSVFKLSDVITTDNVLEQQQQGMEIKETCVSFAMFWLLLARIAGYYNLDVTIDFDELLFKEEHPNHDQKTSNQISIASPSPLLPPTSPNVYNSTNLNHKKEDEVDILFRLVEVELEFLCSYLYTNTYAIYARGVRRKLCDLGVIVLFFVLALPLLVEYRTQDRNSVYVVKHGYVLDTGFTRFIILAILASEFIQMISFLRSKWAKVLHLCAPLRKNQSIMKTLIEIWSIKIANYIPLPRFDCFNNIRIKWFTKVKLGQYSVLKCYNKIPTLLWFNCWIGSYVELPRKGQDGKKTTYLSPELKKEIFQCLKRRGGRFTKGVASLKANGVNDKIIKEYLTDFGLESQARVILIWHIATSLFEEERPPKLDYDDKDDNFQVATKFSKYCAYLVAFNPQMIPGSVRTTECMFDQVVRELKNNRSSANDHGHDMAVVEETQEEMDDLEEEKLSGETEEPILRKARQLKEDLKNEDYDNARLWKILAEFWTEMLLFLALCSDHKDVLETHANGLSVGGEFMTHLWALVKHKGCQLQVTECEVSGKSDGCNEAQNNYEDNDTSSMPISKGVDAISKVVQVIPFDDLFYD